MNTAVIEVAFANPKKDGKKFASLKTQEGDFYLVEPHQLGLYQPGRAYEVEFEEWSKGDRSFRTIKGKPKPKDPTSASNNPVPLGTGPLHAEQEFVARLLAASIQACAVGHTKEALIAEVKLWRAIWRETFP